MQCAGIKRDGQRCGSQVLSDGTHCYVHAPSKQAERAEARRRGGQNRSNVRRAQKVMPARLAPVFARLETVLDRLDTDAIDPKTAQVMASVARAMATILTAGELEQRVRALEERTG